MRKYFLILLLLISAAGFSQTAPNIIYGKDVIIQTRDTSSAELTIKNSTRNVLGYFKNIGGGKGQYTLIPQVDITALPDSLLARYTKTQADARFKSISYIPDWVDITGKPANFSTTYALSNDIQDSLLNKVSRNGSYANPSWITSLDYSKLTGTVPTWNQNTTGNAATVTNGVYTTGSYADPSWITGLAWSKISGAPAFITGINSTMVTTALGYTPENAANKGIANGYADLDAGGKIPASRIDFGQTGQTFVVASQSAMLAVSGANIGALAIRTDQNKNYRLIAQPASTLANWQVLLSPDAPVQSVNGFTGNVNLLTTHISEGSNYWWTAARSRAAQSLTTSGSSGAATYDNTTGVLNIPTYTLAGLGGQPALSGTGFVKISGTTITYDNSTYLTSYTETDPTIYAWAKATTKPSYSWGEITGTVPTWNQNTTGNAGNVTGIVAIANGGTGSATKNFVDLTTAQTIGGAKTFIGSIIGEGNALFRVSSTNILNIGADQSMYGGSNNDGGIFVYGANKLHLSTNSSRQVTVDGSGNTTINNGSLTIGSTAGTGTGSLFAGAGSFGGDLTVSKASPLTNYNRTATNQFNGIRLQTSSTNNWGIGSAWNGANTDFEIYNYSTSSTALKINYSDNAATLIGSLSGTSALFTGGFEAGRTGGVVSTGDLSVVTTSTAAQVIIGRISGTGNDNTNLVIRNRVGTQTGLWTSADGALTAASARLSGWVTDASYSRFGHSSYNTSTNYGFLQDASGNAYIQGTTVYIGSSGGNNTAITSAGINSSGSVTANSIINTGSNSGTSGTLTNILFKNLAASQYNVAQIESVLDGQMWASSLVFRTADVFNANLLNERMRITSGGSVGIGTSSPSQRVHVAGTGVARILVENTDNQATGAGVQMLVRSSGTVVADATIRVDNTGKFSIFNGATSPAENFSISPTGASNFASTTTSTGFIKSGSSDSYFLLGGGGHVATSTYATTASLSSYVNTTGNQYEIGGNKSFLGAVEVVSLKTTGGPGTPGVLKFGGKTNDTVFTAGSQYVLPVNIDGTTYYIRLWAGIN